MSSGNSRILSTLFRIRDLDVRNEGTRDEVRNTKIIDNRRVSLISSLDLHLRIYIRTTVVPFTVDCTLITFFVFTFVTCWYNEEPCFKLQMFLSKTSCEFLTAILCFTCIRIFYTMFLPILKKFFLSYSPQIL